MTTTKPGEICSVSGLYIAVTPWGELILTPKNLFKGYKVPPTPFPECYYVLLWAF
ncbi:hypothetical protein V0288_22895 [Pannus brasiliensis CCIBt3594]|uniref:Uncharacterized protein n=1 Tax=Pannus brasiliensis CCIBt3594 TaxID=1427578 RepID=A0AAW9R1R7_9CHRO